MSAPISEPTGSAMSRGYGERRPIASVIGDGDAGEEARRIAERLGRCLVDAGFRVLTGGLGGVMESASRGARLAPRYQAGDVIGILPGYRSDAANPHVDIAICSGLGHARNVLCAASGDVVLAIRGSSGTLNEIAIAWTLGRPVACVGRAEGWALELAETLPKAPTASRMAGPFSPEEAADWSTHRLEEQGGT